MLGGYAERQHGQQHIKAEGGQKADQSRFAHIGRILRPSRQNHGAFHADEAPQRHQHRGFDLRGDRSQILRSDFGGISPEVRIELRETERKQQNDDEQKEREHIAGRSDQVHQTGFFDAGQHQEIVEPDQNGTEDHGIPIISSGENSGKEIVQRIHQDHGKRHVPEYGHQPVSPGGDESDEFAESLPGIHIDAGLQVGPDVRQDPEGIGDEIDAQTDDQPGDDDRTGRG